jgi:hypothetical protein
MKKELSSFLGLVHKYLPWALNVAYLVVKLVNEAANYRVQLRSQVPAEGGHHGLCAGRCAEGGR